MQHVKDVISNSSDPNSQLRLYVAFTLVDITKTNTTHPRADADIFSRNQQHNWETVVQIIGLRAQPILLEAASMTVIGVEDFGSAYSGQHKVWSFKFGIEHEGVYSLPNREFGILEQDFTGVPIITGLSETASFEDPIFYSEGSNKNIYFKSLQIE